MNFWTLRHPPTDAKGICVGQHKVPLTMSQKEACTRALETAPLIPDIIYSSDLPRCMNLASRLGSHWGIPHRVDIRLREISMGEWEGKSYDSLLQDTRWNTWCENWLTARPPGGEALADLQKRVLSWLDETDISAKTLLVSHAGVVRSLYQCAGLSWEDAMQQSVVHLKWQRITIPKSE
ncbi:MAG: histidine phosphatase family protein [Myxococcota bacterium]|nr:histidine phosphatase family protein [Myxococcota bacterium]